MRRSPLLVVGVLLLALVACARVRPATLVVGTSGDYPPFTVERDGMLDGLDLDVARAFAHDTGRRLTLVRVRWSDLLPALRERRVDLVMGGVTMRPERAIAGTFTRPVATTGAVVLAPPALGSRVADLDRPEVRLAVNAGGHLERVARRLFPHSVLVLAPDNALAERVRSGAADAVVTDDAEALALAQALPTLTRRGPFTRDRKAYLGRDPALVADLDAWLRARETDGTLAALRARWLGPERAGRHTTFESDIGALVALIDLRLALMPAVAAAKERAGRPVEDAAQERRVLDVAAGRAGAAELEPASLVTLFAAQIEAARALQHTFLATPPEHRPPVERLDLTREARPALDALSEAIVARAADVARDQPALSRLRAEDVAEDLDRSVPAAARAKIAHALRALRPASTGVGKQPL